MFVRGETLKSPMARERTLMRSWLITCGLLITTFCSTCFGQHNGWHSGYGEASAASERDGVPILLHFHAWYCGPCQRMNRDVFPDREVQRLLGTDIASVEIDVTREPELASQYGASTVPRDVVVFGDGTVETLNVGYMSKSSYSAMLRDIASRGKAKQKREAPVPRPVDPQIQVQPETPRTVNEPALTEPKIQTLELTRTDPPILGLEGYCPVQLLAHRQWTPGQSSISAEYRDILYQFATESDRETFLKNPSSYSPQDLGCDPVILTSDSRAVTGSIRFGAFFDQKLYLFRSKENREQFKSNPLKFTKIRSALRADQIEGTRFR